MATIHLVGIARELSSYNITVTFKDENGADLSPDTATWTLTELDGTVVNSRQGVSISSPTASEKVRLQGNDLAILDGDDIEDRVFTVEATYDSSTPIKDEARFQVQALVAVS